MTIEPSTTHDPNPPVEVEVEAAPPASWTMVQPMEPWALYGRGWLPLAYRRVRDQVEVVGAVCDGRRGAPVFQLPEGLRPAGMIMRSGAVAGTTGICTATVRPDGLLVVGTDRWSGDRTHLDLEITFPVADEQLAQAVEALAATAVQRPTRPENHNGVIVQVPV
jgi:hypothetical protein